MRGWRAVQEHMRPALCYDSGVQSAAIRPGLRIPQTYKIGITGLEGN